MRKGLKKLRLVAAVLAFAMMLSPAGAMQASAAAITTNWKELPKSSVGNRSDGNGIAKITINTEFGKSTYTMYDQWARFDKPSQPFMHIKSCAECAVSCVLSVYGPKSKKSDNKSSKNIYTPEYVRYTLEPKACKNQFNGANGADVNYTPDALEKGGPTALGLKGEERVLNYLGIKTKRYSHGQATTLAKRIVNHLKKGKPVIIVVMGKDKKKNRWDKVWTNGIHNVVALGIASNGLIIVADSIDTVNPPYDATEKKYVSKSYSNQYRFKYVSIANLIYHMKTSTSANRCDKHYYYCGGRDSSGFILVG